jgi:hypothetical protein
MDGGGCRANLDPTSYAQFFHGAHPGNANLLFPAGIGQRLRDGRVCVFGKKNRGNVAFFQGFSDLLGANDKPSRMIFCQTTALYYFMLYFSVHTVWYYTRFFANVNNYSVIFMQKSFVFQRSLPCRHLSAGDEHFRVFAAKGRSKSCVLLISRE